MMSNRNWSSLKVTLSHSDSVTYRCNYLNGKLFNWNTSNFHLCINETLFECFLKQKTILEDCWIFSRDSVTWYSLRNLKRSSGSLTTAFFFLLIHILKDSKKKYAKKWRNFFLFLWCHTITDGTNLRRSPLHYFGSWRCPEG